MGEDDSTEEATKKSTHVTRKKKRGFPTAIIAAIIGAISGCITTVLGPIISNVLASKRISTVSNTLSVDTVGARVHVSFLVTVKNNGNVNFGVTKPVKVRLWLISMDELTKQKSTDWYTFMKRKVDDTALDSSYMTTYVAGDSVKNSFDFFLDNSDFNKRKCTVLIRADAEYKRYYFGVSGGIDTDYCYNVHLYREMPTANKPDKTVLLKIRE